MSHAIAWQRRYYAVVPHQNLIRRKTLRRGGSRGDART
jgi:hypothetical protein